jgi:hypothetical protein
LGDPRPRLFADDRGVWQEDKPGQLSGIAWDEVYCVSGHKLDRVTEVYTCVVMDWEYGEFVELYYDCPGFEQVVGAITERLPGIAPNWFEQVEALGTGDPPVEVWRRTEPVDVIYHAPDGSTTRNPTAEALAEIVLRQSAAYWNYGSGDSGLTRDDCDESLVFFFVDPYGVYVAFVPEGQVEVVTRSKSDTKATVEHYVGGDPMVRPQACFLPRELALEVVRDFADHGRRLPKLTWVPLYQIEYEDSRWEELKGGGG